MSNQTVEISISSHYSITLQMCIDAANAGSREFFVYKNGNQTLHYACHRSDTGTSTTNCWTTTLMKLNALDVLDVCVYQTNSGGASVHIGL
jgi:hypothetical protein